MTVHRPTAIVAAATLAFALVAIGGGQTASAATFVVDSTADEPDANPGDGVCADAGGACTLRAAVEEANATPGADVITLPAGTYDVATPLEPSGDLTVTGAGAASTTIFGSGTNQNATVFLLGNGAITMNVSGITFRNNDDWACIRMVTGADGSTLDVSDSVFDRCGDAGISAITDGDSFVSVTDTVITGDPTSSCVACYGIFIVASSGSLTADNLTVQDTYYSTLFVVFDTTPATISITNSLLTGSSDGGLESYTDGGGTITIQSSTFSDNGWGLTSSATTGADMTTNVTGSNFDGNRFYHAQLTGAVTIEDTSFVNSPGDEDGNNGWGFEWVGLQADDQLTVRRSTVANNLGYGIGLFPRESTQQALFENVTISGNGGIGIFTDGDTRFVNSTIVGNREFGIDPGGSTTFLNTIVAGNTAPDEDDVAQPADCQIGVEALIVSEGGNIDSDGSCRFTQPTDQPSTDPLLGPLADNGGATITHLPATGSPAIDRGLTTGCPGTDQRGVTRPQGAGCDAGSVEVASQTVTPTTAAPTTTAPTTTVAPTTVAPTTAAPTTVAPTTVAPSPPAPVTVAPTLPATGSSDTGRTTAGLALAALLTGLALIAVTRRRTT